jgi:hypothetical protein
MVNFKNFCENITEEEYRAIERPSYSFFKELDDKGPSVIRDGIDFKMSAGLTLGSIVDNLITQEDYDPLEEYHITNIAPDLSGSTHHSKLLKYVYDNEIKDPSEDILKEACTKLGFKKNPSLTDSKFEAQLNMVKGMLNGKKYLNQREYELAMQMAETLQSHEYTKDIFNDGFDLEAVNQAIILFTLKGLPVKSMLDRVLVDHNKKIIYPYDLKTGAFYDFMQNFWKYKYYLQGGMYTAAVYYIIENHPEFKDYTVEPFRFVYISRERPDLPLVYEMPKKFIEYGLTGWTTIGGRKYKGILELVEDYKWYLENEEYDLRREVVENNGLIRIKEPIV